MARLHCAGARRSLTSHLGCRVIWACLRNRRRGVWLYVTAALACGKRRFLPCCPGDGNLGHSSADCRRGGRVSSGLLASCGGGDQLRECRRQLERHRRAPCTSSSRLRRCCRRSCPLTVGRVHLYRRARMQFHGAGPVCRPCDSLLGKLATG